MMRRGAEDFDERFTAFVRSRGEHHIRMATLLTGNPGPVSGLGWTGTRYRFTLWRPDGTGRLVDFITCTVDVDSQGHVRKLLQSIGFAAGGKAGAAVGQIYTLDFSFSDFGARFSVTRPPASQIDPDVGVAVQF